MVIRGGSFAQGIWGMQKKGIRMEFLGERHSVLNILGGIFPSDQGSNEGKDIPGRKKIMLHVARARNSFMRALSCFGIDWSTETTVRAGE